MQNALTRRLFLLTTAASAAFCSATPALSDPLPVRIAWQPGFAARFFMARDLALFEKADLAPTYLKFVAGPPMLAALKSGDVDVAFMSVNPFLAGLAQEIGLQIFLVESDELQANGLVVRPDSGIAGVADLNGKRVGVTRGSASYYGLKKAMENFNLTTSQVDVRDLAVPTWIPAFSAGDVDALWVWSPWLYKLEDIGGKTVATLGDVGISLMQNVYVARTEWLESNPDAARRFVHAFDMATDALKTDRQVAMQAVADALSTSPDQTDRLFAAQTLATLDEMVDPAWANSLVGDDGMRKGLQAQAAFMHNEGFFKQMPDISAATNPTAVIEYLKVRQ